MNVQTEKKDNYQVVLTIEVALDKWEKAIKDAVVSIANQVKIPGFRKGKAPRSIIERQVGVESIIDEAYNKIAPVAFREALEQEKLELASVPEFEEVSIEEGKPMVFKATITPKPEVKLGEYKNLKVEKKEVNITDEDVDAHIKKIRERHGKLLEAPEGAAVADGDLTTLDFKGFVDDAPFEGGEGKDYPLQIGSGSFIPGFEEQLIGAKIGEERDVNVTFPEDYHSENLAGKKALFKCTIRSIRQRELPELNDEFVEKVSVFKTVDEFKADVKKHLEEATEQNYTNERRAAAIKQATDNITVDVPPVMVEDRINQMINELAMRLEHQGMSLEKYLSYAKTDINHLRDEYKKTAEENVRTDLMLEAVAKEENIKVESFDFDTEIAIMAKTYGATPKQVLKVVKEQGRIGDLAVTILRRKTAQFIVSSITE